MILDDLYFFEIKHRGFSLITAQAQVDGYIDQVEGAQRGAWSQFGIGANFMVLTGKFAKWKLVGSGSFTYAPAGDDVRAHTGVIFWEFFGGVKRDWNQGESYLDFDVWPRPGP